MPGPAAVWDEQTCDHWAGEVHGPDIDKGENPDECAVPRLCEDGVVAEEDV